MQKRKKTATEIKDYLMQIKQNSWNNKGVAMLMVLIVSAVVLVFCLSLLLVTYSLFSQSARQTGRLQCKLYAQSCEESLNTELKNPDSELVQYMKKQIENGSWIMEGEEEKPDASQDAVTELTMQLKTGNKAEGYDVTIAFTYEVNASDDDGGDDSGDEDDQDKNLAGGADGQNAENAKGNEGDQNPGNAKANAGGQNAGSAGTASGEDDADTPVVSYTVNAVIRCTKGSSTDRDVQYYEIEASYPSVSL